MINKRQLLFAAATVAVGLSIGGCGGGGGGDSSAPVSATPPPPARSPPPATPPSAPFWATTAEIFSGDAGSQWILDGRDERGAAPARTYRSRVTVESVAIALGQTFSQFRYERALNESQPFLEWAFNNQDGVYSIETLQGAPPPASLAGATLELQSPVRLHDRYVVFEESGSTRDLDGDGVADRETFRVENEVRAIERLVVPAGTIGETARVVSTAVATATSSRTGQTVAATSTLTQWYAKGLGAVKRVFVDPDFSAPNNTVTEELIGIDTSSVKAGLGREFSAFATAAEQPPFVESTDVASDGTNILFVAGVRGNGPNRVLGRLFNPSGQLLWERVVLESPTAGEFFGGVVASFDGTVFHVVAAKTNTRTGPLLRQRVTPQGSLLDGAGAQLVAAEPETSFAPLRPVFNVPRVLYAWHKQRQTGGLGAQANHFLIADASGTPLGAPSTVAESEFRGRSIPVLQRAGEFAILAQAPLPPIERTLSVFRVDSAGTVVNPGGTAFITSSSPTMLPFIAGLVNYGGNAMPVWLRAVPQVGNGFDAVMGSLLFADSLATVIAPPDAQVFASSSAAEQRFIDSAAVESVPTGTALVYLQTRGSSLFQPDRLKAAWFAPNPSPTSAPTTAAMQIDVTSGEEFELQLLAAATAGDAIVMLRRDRVILDATRLRLTVVRGPVSRP